MVAEGFLYETSGRLAMGDQAEQVYGRKNFMGLYAVFSSPARYNVLTAQRQAIGSLDQNFVDSLVEGVTTFLLGGRAWVADNVNHSERTIRVRPAPAGKRPSWGGFAPQMLSFELCQQIRKILTDDCEYPYLNKALATELKDKREELGETLRKSTWAVELEPGEAHLWTFAGGRINQTLRHIFALVGGFKVVSDNFELRIKGDSVTHKAINEVIERMRDPAFWTDRSVWGPIAGALPDYRLSKFQRALPAQFSEEMVIGFLLDVAGARRLAEEADAAR